MYEFKLPDLGEGIHEGEILKWHVKTGDAVQEDEPLVDIETDKAAVTIPSPASGTIAETRGDVGAVVQVGDVICRIDDGAAAAVAAPKPAEKTAGKPAEKTAEKPAEKTAEKPAEKPAEKRAEEPAQKSQPQPERKAAAALHVQPAAEVERRAGAGTAGRVHVGPVPAAPATRRLARELGVDLRDVSPSGPGGRVLAEDVRQLAAQTKGERPAAAAPRSAAAPVERDAEPEGEAAAGQLVGPGAAGIPLLEIEALPDFSKLGPVEVEPLRSIRRKTAKKMVIAATLIPHVAHMDDADVTDLEDVRRRMRERYEGEPGGRLTLLPFVMKAVVAGLKAAPKLNASIDPVKQEIVYKKFYNLGFAADTPKGLVVPVVRGVDGKSVLALSAEVVSLALAARDGTIDAGAFQGGTFTITNIGPLGGRYFTPVINYPEVGILAMGRMEERAVVREGRVVVRKILPLTLSFDHRLVDGADGARFMDGLLKRLADPERLLMEI